MIGGVAPSPSAWAARSGSTSSQKGEPADKAAAARREGALPLVFDKWRVDELYDAVVVRPAKALRPSRRASTATWSTASSTWWAPWHAARAGAEAPPDGAIQVYGAAIGVGALALVGLGGALAPASIAHRAGDRADRHRGQRRPRVHYRWAFYDPEPRPEANRLDQRCPVDRATEALEPRRRGAVTTETQRSETITTPRCVVVEATNAFGRTTRPVPRAPQAADNPTNPRSLKTPWTH
jgi:hypothetical protein